MGGIFSSNLDQRASARSVGQRPCIRHFLPNGQKASGCQPLTRKGFVFQTNNFEMYSSSIGDMARLQSALLGITRVFQGALKEQLLGTVRHKCVFLLSVEF